MTREEAIEQLQNCKGLIKQDGKDWLDERDIPLIDMAIDALQTEPSPKDMLDGTLVVKVPNAKEVGRVLVQDADENVHIGGGLFYVDDSADRPTLKQTDTLIIADALRYLAEDEERHEKDRARAEKLREQVLAYGARMCADRPSGKWQDKMEHLMGLVCSECGYLILEEELETHNYCPSCGAFMKGGTE